ncbi:FKBP-type peptidyl-prolyl cis-trans isomerase [Marinomonas sp. TI.3.20]|uniref:FKBP-type peptidyl-prolyl cis-trans isomerase n=1 Tax=Marinomonas sp. TI.3.20 TaxID=3121296 RepID=UPI00311E9F66
MIKKICSLIALSIATQSYAYNANENIGIGAAQEAQRLMINAAKNGELINIDLVVKSFTNYLKNKETLEAMKKIQSQHAMADDSARKREMDFLNSLTDMPLISQTKSGIFYIETLQPEEWAMKRPKPNDSVVFQITAKTQMQKKIDELQDQRIISQVDRLPNGLALIILDMKAGERRKVYLPSWSMYGSQARNGVPAFSTIIADIQLLDIQEAPIKQNSNASK